MFVSDGVSGGWCVCVCVQDNQQGSSTDACGAEGAVYLVRRDGIGGGGLSVLNRFGGECLYLHGLSFWEIVWDIGKLDPEILNLQEFFFLFWSCGGKQVFTQLARFRFSRHGLVGSPEHE